MKFEMEFGWIGDEKLTVETHDFEKIKIIQEFIEFQEENDWCADYVSVDFEEDTEEEEVVLTDIDDNE
jgi:hypothetical protein